MTDRTPTPGAQLSAAERVARNARIATARAAGDPWQMIADREHVSVRQARRCLDEHLRAAGAAIEPINLGDVDPHRIWATVVADHLDVLRALAVEARHAAHDGARVGALRARATVGAQLLHVLQLGGLAPPTPLRWRDDRDLQAIVERMIAALSEFDRRVLDVAFAEATGDAARSELIAAADTLRETFNEVMGVPEGPVLEVGGKTGWVCD